HDHAMRVPRPDLSVAYGTPNACNNCHKNKTAKWAYEAVDKWYGKTRAYHFAEDLIPGSRGGADAESHLLTLLNKPNIPEIVRAAAVNYLGNVQTSSGLNAILSCINSKDAQVRYRAVIALKNYDEQEWIGVAAPLLQDAVRAVRVAATDLFLTIPIANIPGSYQSAFLAAKDEHLQFLYNQADFSTGSLSLGDYYARLADYGNAEKFYLRGIKKDNLMNLARLNLSIVYNLDNKNNEALAVLKDAEKIDPENENVLFNMGLLYNEMGNKTAALETFEKGLKIKAINPRLYYNYGLLLLNTDEAKAEQVLKKGLLQANNNADLHYALAFLYLRQKQPTKAMSHAQILKELNPNNPNYAQIFNTLKL
ncbi:MAG TPA: tetratricopeptide repeat protein, partial [Pelobium sp.]|nr:tetratricopeptide repeat protein [Pelobium sp.]